MWVLYYRGWCKMDIEQLKDLESDYWLIGLPRVKEPQPPRDNTLEILNRPC